MDDSGGNAGGTAIYGPRGEVVAEAGSKFEQSVEGRIPMAMFRATRKTPDVHMALYLDAFNAYRPRLSPGLFSAYLPTDLKDAKRYLDAKDQWR
jgi:hypothetical protein